MFESLKKRFQAVFSGRTDSILYSDLEPEILEILLTADVSYDTAQKISEEAKKRLPRQRKIAIQEAREAFKAAMTEIIDSAGSQPDLLSFDCKPSVILFLGINGTGKTTTIAKVAEYLKRNGKRTVIAAADTFRAGAIEQLAELSAAVGVPLIRHAQGSDPSAVAFDAIEHARARNLDFVLIDSAGRMQTNRNLMEEMKKIRRVSKPDLTVLVLDAMIGQDAVSQARTFFSEVSYDCIVLTKMDTDARGGAILSITNELKKPVLYIGVGQGLSDLQKFDAEWYLSKILP